MRSVEIVPSDDGLVIVTLVKLSLKVNRDVSPVIPAPDAYNTAPVSPVNPLPEIPIGLYVKVLNDSTGIVTVFGVIFQF